MIACRGDVFRMTSQGLNYRLCLVVPNLHEFFFARVSLDGRTHKRGTFWTHLDSHVVRTTNEVRLVTVGIKVDTVDSFLVSLQREMRSGPCDTPHFDCRV
jgi:hypothetical protein